MLLPDQDSGVLKMRMSYRGIPYNHEPLPVDTVESQVGGRYRGHGFNFSYPRHIPVPQPILDLKYRGVTYRTTSTGLLEHVAPVASSTNEVVSTRIKRSGLNRQSFLREVTQIHTQNIQKRLQHRLEVARVKGDSALVAQLEQEMQQVM
jgi:predicted DNA binding CopG/RHH family protein